PTSPQPPLEPTCHPPHLPRTPQPHQLTLSQPPVLLTFHQPHPPRTPQPHLLTTPQLPVPTSQSPHLLALPQKPPQATPHLPTTLLLPRRSVPQRQRLAT
ncbi:hypothetical protein HDU77_004366, partial [Chytriomyces hyalinus]